MRLSGTTTMLGLIGTPVEHSKSPAMYNHCFAKYGLDWAYLAFDISPEKAGDAVQAIRTLHMRGANVTMPCKNAVIPYLDELTPAARAIQAANTIVNDNGRLVGHNTDGCDILSNATRVGMAPYENVSNITDLSWFRRDLVVTDVVYSPAEIRMLREARAAGCRTCDGLGMLLCQGAEAFRLYSGLEMPIEEIRALLYT
jgi:shikimate 5-dehydrogenase